ncbi:MAG: 4-(cytidine 5'-diphospho)-2-C-methyl-D-erythritol kinase [Candidatus Kapabacteria bacterium]|nr:4-(cytidine 5'-diphospho)-2-C-methyl-D-erythritol kinase [Candidatus Kapabacteria bacterium]
MKLIKKLAYAKINLGLQVLNKRLDGFHNINTVFFRTKLADEMIFKSNDTGEINIKINVDLGIPQEQNLIFKVAAKIQDKYNVKLGVDIELTKNIPFGGGLGGGSSDAAETIKALSELWDLDIPFDNQLIIAQALGSDIPYFLKYGTAVGNSRGEKLFYFDYDMNFQLLIVSPNIHISTPDAYNALGRTLVERQIVNFANVLIRADDNPSLLKEFVFNDFEENAFTKHNELLEIKNKLYENGAHLALMSGSGSTMFGIFDLNKDLSEIQKIFSNYKTLIS